MALPPWEVLNALVAAADEQWKKHPENIGGNLYAEAASVISQLLLALKPFAGPEIADADDLENAESTYRLYAPRDTVDAVTKERNTG